MELSLIEKFFDLVGRVCFPRQQVWERRRTAKIMTAAVTTGVFLGALVLWLFTHLNGFRK